MVKRTDKQIGEAVKQCLDRCYARGDTPLGAIAEFAAELRENGWSDTDVKLVELSARKVLAGVVGHQPPNDSAG